MHIVSPSSTFLLDNSSLNSTAKLCTLSRHAADAKLCGQGAEGRGDTHRDLDRLERWLCVNLSKSSQVRGAGSGQSQEGLGRGG